MPFIPVLTTCCALALFVLSGHAAGRDEEARARLPESVTRIEAETGGRVLQVRPMQRGDEQVYRMKVLTPEGRVRVMQDDPRRRTRDGSIVSMPRERERPPVPERERERERDRND